jgi:hypothetical protein
MTRLEDRQTLVAEIADACTAGARLAPVCSAAWPVSTRGPSSAGAAATARCRPTVGPGPSGPGRRTP